MMIRPIQDYLARDNRPREPNGKLSRKHRPSEHMVYVVRQEGSDRIKVGRTKNAAARMQCYESSSGVPVRYLAQIVVGSLDDAKALERQAIAAFKAAFPSFKREWFAIGAGSLFGILATVVKQATVPISAVRGCSPSDVPEWSNHRAMVDSVYRMTRGHRR